MCSYLVTTEVPKRVCTTRDVERNWSWSQTSLRIASRDRFGQCLDDKFELIAFGAGTDQGHDDHDCKFRALGMPETCKTVSVGRVQAWSFVVGGNPGSRAVVCPIPRVELLQERSVVSGMREETQRGELQCHVEDDTAKGPFVKTVTDRGKSGAHRRTEALHAHVQMERRPEFHLDCAYMGTATEDQELWMCRFSEGRWLIAREEECENGQRYFNVGKLVNEMITSDMQALKEVKFDQETLNTDVKNTLAGGLRNVGRQGKSCGESRSVERSNNVSKESPMSASTANALIEKSVREMQSTVRTIVAYIEEVHGTTFESGSASSTWTAEIVGHVIRFQSSVADVKTTC